MRDILADIVAKKREIVEKGKRQISLATLKDELQPASFAVSRKFRRESWSLIAECKLQSPAKGRLTEGYTVDQLAKIYAANGASALSIHTDPHFLGKNEDLQRVRKLVDIPLLRKDFIIDPYQIYEARYLGADAVLLIARILSKEQLKEFVFCAWELGMDTLVEVHDEADMEAALYTPAELIGINNRNLKTFTTSIEQTLSLLSIADKERFLISESGIFSAKDARALYDAGCDGILVGEGLVRAEDVGEMTRALKGMAESRASA
ncbi:indole-3-glycerol phosphate synthase TrpC [Selenomonas sp. TAMA-11512]|uniref:indole-3-glycerol phosphate synthase TrpC n=1 Tax=Selenomonas sp. TAMA-11512 TaxID=3095337 RepID=UPI003093D6A2|nr:indole-3-glycerol phosphate synthase TrpC [Selenomonas sp. TAMA-11512]